MQKKALIVFSLFVGLTAIAILPAVLAEIVQAESSNQIYGRNDVLVDSEAEAGPLVQPPRQGKLTRPGEIVAFSIQIQNADQTLDDIFDLEVTSNWPLAFFTNDGQSPLDDTDGDGLEDTGLLLPGGEIIIIAKVSTPALASIGDQNRATIWVVSDRDPNLSQSTILQTAVPAPFAQAFRDETTATPSILLAQKESQFYERVLPAPSVGSESAIAETAAGYLYAWRKERLDDNHLDSEIEFTLLDKAGQKVNPTVKLTDHGGTEFEIRDINPVVAVSPQGHMAIGWHQQQDDGPLRNENIFFAILEENGELISGPTDITANDDWGVPGSDQAPFFDAPRIAIAPDGNILVAWQLITHNNSDAFNNIAFAIVDPQGSIIKSPQILTGELPPGDGHFSPAVISLSTNRFFLSWAYRRPANDDDIFFVILDSLGEFIQGPTNLSETDDVTDWFNFDAVELSDGAILAVWQAYGCIEGEYTGRLRYALVRGMRDNYRRAGQPACLGSEPLAKDQDLYASLAADGEGHGIVTWTGPDGLNRHHIYYALVNTKGNVVTEPMIFYPLGMSDESIDLNHEGYALTSRLYHDGAAAFDSDIYFGGTGEVVTLPINFANKGTELVTDVTITVTIDLSLTYVSDTSPVNPIINGTQIRWDLQDLPPSAFDMFDLSLQLPANEGITNTFPITVTITIAEPDIVPENNEDYSKIILAKSIFLPIIASQP